MAPFAAIITMFVHD